MNLSKKSKWILSIFIIGLVAAYGGYNYMMQPPKTVEERNVDYTGNAKEFIEKVKKEPLKWADKVVVLEGIVTSKDGLGINLDSKIYCQFKEATDISPLKRNQKIKIKGRFIGYDDLMDELKLEQCIIQK